MLEAMAKGVRVAERPILFRGPMVRAILEGRKTQTRRLVKWPETPEPDYDTWVDDGWPYFHRTNRIGAYDEIPLDCPYGQPGDRLWVRENCFLDKQIIPALGRRRVFFADSKDMRFDDGEAGQSPCALPLDCMKLNVSLKQVPSIHMPRWASRITLEVVNVRVERLQEISCADAAAEGFESPRSILQNIGEFKASWDSHNKAPHDWASNPWVWVVDFKRPGA